MHSIRGHRWLVSLFALLCASAALAARAQDAERFEVRNAYVELVNGSWQLDVRLDLGLAEAAQQAFEEGVPLVLKLEIEATVERRLLLDEDVVSMTREWQLAYDAIVSGEAEFRADTGEEAVRQAYERGETDEFIKPTVVGAEGHIRDGDAAIFFNFRPDRARQLTSKLGEIEGLHLTTLTEYNEDWDYPVAFPPARPDVTLASTLADRGKRQLHVAETEKYAHVTYFFNGGEEHPYPGEERSLVDSPRDVPTYDKEPEMAARAAAEAFVRGWRDGDYSFGVINFANPDMVGHTGVIEAAVKAVQTVDGCLGQVVEAVQESGGVCIVTADHGNADQMLEPDGSPNTAHSMNPVPLVITGDVGELREGGTLADVAPTVLDLLGEPQPDEMTGKTLKGV